MVWVRIPSSRKRKRARMNSSSIQARGIRSCAHASCMRNAAAMQLIRPKERYARMTASSIRTVTVGLGLSPKSALKLRLTPPRSVFAPRAPQGSRAFGLPAFGLRCGTPAKPTSNYRQWGISPRPETEFIFRIVDPRAYACNCRWVLVREDSMRRLKPRLIITRTLSVGARRFSALVLI